MRARGGYAAIVSGGFTPFTGAIARRLGADEHRANRLEIVGGRLTGRVLEPILGADAKLATLRELTARLGLARHETLGVGDGANDLPMLVEAGSRRRVSRQAEGRRRGACAGRSFGSDGAALCARDRAFGVRRDVIACAKGAAPGGSAPRLFERRQDAILKVLATCVFIGSADSVATFCASAAISLVWPVSVSICLRANSLCRVT